MKIFKSIKYYLGLYKLIIHNSVMSQMEYRFNFIMGMAVQFAFMIVKATYAIIVQRVGVSIDGVSPDQMMLFIGTYSAMSGVYMSFFYLNFMSISGKVRGGTLDMVIVKPVSTQFMVSLGHINIGYAVVSVPIGGAMIVMGWIRAGVPFDFMHVFGYIGLTLCGFALTYFLFLIPATLSFWLTSTSGMTTFTDMLWDFNNMPMLIYNQVIQFVGLFILPIFVITNLGPLAALDRISPMLIVWGIASPFVVGVVQRLIWKKAMKRYTSAS